ncbi:hypothetical protein DRN73_01265 [Candidatus Pacearchaeota archaeon]|nr:MAG: hypothetical protein DRN73_01265 [Candidatus Pacearchaeota archaeon]
MFKFLRKGATSLVAKIFLAVIVIVFVFWGIGTFTIRKKELVAKVNDIPITLKEFTEYYNFKIFQIKQTFGELNQATLKKFHIKEQVLETLIKDKLLETEAEKLGIKIYPIEIKYAIAQISVFQEDGKFSPRKYQTILNRLGITSSFFENLIKYDLLQERIKSVLTSPILVSEKEAKDYFNYTHQYLKIVEAKLPLSFCENQIHYTFKDLKNYYLAHRDMYVSPLKIKLAYLYFPFKGKVKISEKEIKRYYEKNIEKFKQPLRVKLKKIFIPGTNNATYEKALKIKNQLKDLKDFKKFTKEPSTWFEESVFPPRLRFIIEKAKPKEILGPFKLESGYLILGIEDIKPAQILPLNKVKSEIIKKLKKEKIIQEVTSKVDSIYREVIKEDGLTLWAKKEKVRLSETKYLTRKELLNMFPSFKVVQKILEASKGEYLAPITTQKGIYLVEIIDKKPPRNLKFEEVKSKVKKDYLKDKGKELCENKAKKLIYGSRENDFIENAKKEGFTIKVYDKIQRYKLSQNFSAFITQILFNKGNPDIIEKPVLEDNWIKVFYIKNITPSDKLPSSEDLKIIASYLIKEKREAFLNQWYKNLREKAKIKIYSIFKQF